MGTLQELGKRMDQIAVDIGKGMFNAAEEMTYGAATQLPPYLMMQDNESSFLDEAVAVYASIVPGAVVSGTIWNEVVSPFVKDAIGVDLYVPAFTDNYATRGMRVVHEMVTGAVKNFSIKERTWKEAAHDAVTGAFLLAGIRGMIKAAGPNFVANARQSLVEDGKLFSESAKQTWKGLDNASGGRLGSVMGDLIDSIRKIQEQVRQFNKEGILDEPGIVQMHAGWNPFDALSRYFRRGDKDISVARPRPHGRPATKPEEIHGDGRTLTVAPEGASRQIPVPRTRNMMDWDGIVTKRTDGVVEVDLNAASRVSPDGTVEFRIGRKPQTGGESPELVIKDNMTVSGDHAVVSYDPELRILAIEDRSTHSSTYLDGKRPGSRRFSYRVSDNAEGVDLDVGTAKVYLKTGKAGESPTKPSAKVAEPAVAEADPVDLDTTREIQPGKPSPKLLEAQRFLQERVGSNPLVETVNVTLENDRISLVIAPKGRVNSSIRISFPRGFDNGVYMNAAVGSALNHPCGIGTFKFIKVRVEFNLGEGISVAGIEKPGAPVDFQTKGVTNAREYVYGTIERDDVNVSEPPVITIRGYINPGTKMVTSQFLEMLNNLQRMLMDGNVTTP